MANVSNILLFTFAIGVAQGIFLSVVLLHLRGANRRATQTLAGLVLCFTLVIGEEFLDAAGLYATFPHAICATTSLDLLIGPLMLFYAWFITDPNRRFSAKHLLNFMPFILSTLFLVPFYILSAEEKLSYFQFGIPTEMLFLTLFKAGVLTIYLIAVIKHLRAFLRRNDQQSCYQNQYDNALWFLRANYGLVGVGVISLVLYGLSYLGLELPLDSDYFGSAALSSAIYFILFLLIKYPFASSKIRPRAKYETSPLDAEKKKEYLEVLRDYMSHEKPFVDMDLNLEKLAKAVGISPSYISQILNEVARVNFYEFINGYRVEEVKMKIADPSQSHMKMLSLAHEAGFNSKASFNRAFKRLTGLTPIQYKNKISPP